MSENLPDAWRIERVDRADRREWGALLSVDAAASPFHDPFFVELFARHREGAAAAYLELRDAAGTLRAGLPYLVQRRGPFHAMASGPSGTYGGPVSLDPAHRGVLIEAYFSGGGRRTLRREMLCRGEMDSPSPLLEASNVGSLSVEGGFEFFLRERFPRNRRNECARSEKRGLACVLVREGEELLEFQRILAEASRRWGAPALEGEFIRVLLREFDAFQLFIVKHHDDVVGGHLCVEQGDELFAWIGATERRSGIFPAPYLFREEARYAAEHGLRRVNLGASEGLPGVAGFKKLVGAAERKHWRRLQEAAPLRILRRRGKAGPA